MQERALLSVLEHAKHLARAAGRAIMQVYERDFAVERKGDDSPVTAADRAAEDIIVAGLEELIPRAVVVAEEAVAAGRVPETGDEFWLVDPLDGTKEFINRNGEFTVNIALVACGKPVLGVVLAPALGILYAGARGMGAYVESGQHRRAITCRRPPAEGLTVLGSRSHGDPRDLRVHLAERRIAKLVQTGSSLKFCAIAAGDADVYPRLGRTMEWDTAAGQAILAAAGGCVLDLAGKPLGYGKPGFENPHFVAWGRWP